MVPGYPISVRSSVVKDFRPASAMMILLMGYGVNASQVVSLSLSLIFGSNTVSYVGTLPIASGLGHFV